MATRNILYDDLENDNFQNSNNDQFMELYTDYTHSTNNAETVQNNSMTVHNIVHNQKNNNNTINNNSLLSSQDHNTFSASQHQPQNIQLNPQTTSPSINTQQQQIQSISAQTNNSNVNSLSTLTNKTKFNLNNNDNNNDNNGNDNNNMIDDFPFIDPTLTGIPVQHQRTHKSHVLYVGNLQWWITDADLRKIFDQFGTVLDVKIHADKVNGKSKSYGYVEFDINEVENAALAREKLHNYELNECRLVIVFATADYMKQVEYVNTPVHVAKNNKLAAQIISIPPPTLQLNPQHPTPPTSTLLLNQQLFSSQQHQSHHPQISYNPNNNHVHLNHPNAFNRNNNNNPNQYSHSSYPLRNNQSHFNTNTIMQTNSNGINLFPNNLRANINTLLSSNPTILSALGENSSIANSGLQNEQEIATTLPSAMIVPVTSKPLGSSNNPPIFVQKNNGSKNQNEDLARHSDNTSPSNESGSQSETETDNQSESHKNRQSHSRSRSRNSKNKISQNHHSRSNQYNKKNERISSRLHLKPKSKYPNRDYHSNTHNIDNMNSINVHKQNNDHDHVENNKENVNNEKENSHKDDNNKHSMIISISGNRSRSQRSNKHHFNNNNVSRHLHSSRELKQRKILYKQDDHSHSNRQHRMSSNNNSRHSHPHSHLHHHKRHHHNNHDNNEHHSHVNRHDLHKLHHKHINNHENVNNEHNENLDHNMEHNNESHNDFNTNENRDNHMENNNNDNFDEPNNQYP